jgi:hypothetical protein
MSVNSRVKEARVDRRGGTRAGAAFAATMLLALISLPLFAQEQIASPAVKLAPFKVNGKDVNINDVPDDANVITITNVSLNAYYVFVNDVPSALNDISDYTKPRVWIIPGRGKWIIRKYIFSSGRYINIKLLTVYRESATTERKFDLAEQFDKNGTWMHGEQWWISEGIVRPLRQSDAILLKAKMDAAIKKWKSTPRATRPIVP